MDVRDDSAPRDVGADERVQLLVPADGELEVARRDPLEAEVLARVAGQLEHLRGQVLQDASPIHGGRGTHLHCRDGVRQYKKLKL